MRDQVGIDLDGVPLDHEFPDDYELEEEDECDIEVEPLFEDELANQATGVKPKRKRKRTKAYAAAEDKLLCDAGCWLCSRTAFMRDQVGIDLDGVPLDHEFPDDYELEEEDECDIEVEPLFEDELANQATGVKPKRKRKRTKAYAAAEDKLLCECWRDIGQDPKTGAEQKHSQWKHRTLSPNGGAHGGRGQAPW